jgi:hypothetical protein
MSSILGGLSYIAKKQLDGGGFRSYRLGEPGVQRPKSYRTTFIPSLIALALADVEGSEAIKEKIAHFLLAERSEGWSWNYWDRASSSMITMPYPDDLDDTFLALAALWKYDSKLFTPTILAHIAHLLFATETQTGGPYSSWLVDNRVEAVWRDVDVVVNGNIASFLALQDISLPHLESLVENAITQRELSSPYYPPLLPAAYFTAKWYKGEHIEELQSMILERCKVGTWGTPHQTAMAVSALLHVGYPAIKLREAIDYLANTQRADGSWPPGPICVDTVRTGEVTVYFTGAASLTTALCIEALTLYEKVTLAREASVGKTLAAKRQYELVVSEAKATIEAIEEAELRVSSLIVLDEIVAQDSDKQIIMLPWLIARAAGVKVGKKTLHNLALTSLWGWMTYTTYDDFLDNEGNPRLLPGAILANRQLLETLWVTLRANKAFQREVAMIMNRLDGANAWEVSHCRGIVEGNVFSINALPNYGNYWQLADRSLGHTIAGIGVLYAAGVKQSSPRMVGLKDFFLHYLIARQLNDDAHDWEEDLTKCHVNAVATLILAQWLKMTGRSAKEGIDLKKDIKALRLIMWESVIDEVCEEIRWHINAAREVLVTPESQLDATQLQPLLTPLEIAVGKALTSRDQAVEFIASL